MLDTPHNGRSLSRRSFRTRSAFAVGAAAAGITLPAACGADSATTSGGDAGGGGQNPDAGFFDPTRYVMKPLLVTDEAAWAAGYEELTDAGLLPPGGDPKSWFDNSLLPKS